MKKIILIVTILLGGFLFQTASAQIRVRLNLNIATQPVWGPVGYDHAEYYYMPDIDVLSATWTLDIQCIFTLSVS